MGNRAKLPEAPVRGANRYPAPLWDGAALILDGRGRVCACRAGLSWPFSEVAAGSAVHELRPEALGELLAALWARCSASGAGGTPVLGELALAAPSGETRRLSLRVAPIARRPGSFAVTARDISLQTRRLEELARRVQELEEQRCAAEDLARGLAHDIRSPLAALGGFLALLQDKVEANLPARDRLAFHHAQLVAKHLEEVVLAGLEQRVPEKVQPAEVRDLGYWVLSETRSAHPDAAFTWSVEGPEVAVAIPGYDFWRVLWNLAENAVRYRHPGRPLRLVLRTARTESGCTVELLDNGIGLASGDEEAIFEKGRRGANAEGTSGTGLGLHQARRLVERWGGRVWAERRFEGALFTIELPVAGSDGSGAASPG